MPQGGVSAIAASAPFCAVIGAGPAGLMAADVLSAAGARVTVFDHRASPARKFLMAGRGGLNLTHSEEPEKFLARYGAAAGRLEPLLRAFPPARLREFCAELGEPTFVGSSGRVFPSSFKASPLLRAWLARLARQGVGFRMRSSFLGFSEQGGLRMRLEGEKESVLFPEASVFALGGASWPKLGSDAAWVEAFCALGVEISPLAPANCGALIGWSEIFRDAFEGRPIKTIRIAHGDASARGDLVVTRLGLEGGPVYALASRLRETIAKTGAAVLKLDLRPDLEEAEIAKRLAQDPGRQSLSTFLRKAAGLGKIEIALLREVQGRALPRDAAALAALIKQLPLEVSGVPGFERAISTSGGVKFEELDARLMLLRRPGVFLAGEMLDFDAPTGGYLLQAAFSTGFAAGEGAADYLGLELRSPTRP
ncbi:NAD(P)/FAD-dependent oxidoreductase [Methylocystis heyeri]|uniref:TIGR03862 family flavoprotein n=1 Tax=Methylocystis heyeri TaxID=391905 RepID=A0A6B8KID4_9HYPH|nr:TIGR03862 family flavoprotein [Methylocystis heyeri]QGM47437.1 TIGR03862 family flavoprotein [Methylocystis heyeri]